MYTTKQVAELVHMATNSTRMLMRKMGIPKAKLYDQSIVDLINKRNDIRQKRKEYVTAWVYVHPDMIPIIKEFADKLVKDFEDKL